MRAHHENRRALALTRKEGHGNATLLQCQPAHRHPRPAGQWDFPERQRALHSDAPQLDEAAPHPTSPGRPFHLLRRGRSRGSHPNQTQGAGARIRLRLAASRTPRWFFQRGFFFSGQGDTRHVARARSRFKIRFKADGHWRIYFGAPRRRRFVTL